MPKILCQFDHYGGWYFRLWNEEQDLLMYESELKEAPKDCFIVEATEDQWQAYVDAMDAAVDAEETLLFLNPACKKEILAYKKEILG